jgi:hypothetical protein
MSTSVSLLVNDSIMNEQTIKFSVDYLNRLYIQAKFAEFQADLSLSSSDAFELALWIIRNIKVNLPED